MRDLSGRLRALLLSAAVVLAWEAGLRFSGLAGGAVPPPSRILRAIWDGWPVFADNVPVTALEAVAGFALGNAVAVLVATLFVLFRPVEDALYPLAVMLQSVPLVALIPIMIIWLGPGYASKVAMTALVSFFPTMVNTVKGLKSAGSGILELMRVLGAGDMTVWRKVRFPNALPFLFAGLKTAAPMSVLGAVVAEWIGSQRGIGFVMLFGMFNYDPPMVWACMVVSALLTMLSFALLSAIERLVIPWHTSVSGEAGGGGDR